MKNNWNRLDNAAKIFPSAVGKSDTQVFRISCELYNKINPKILQNSLNETIKIFKVFQCILRHGLFWYYLESTDIMPQVVEENKQPCGQIYNHNKKNLLFEVSYYKNRINLEVYHVLSDGTGAMHFLTTLLTKYLSELNGIKEPSLFYSPSYIQMSDDSFKRYYTDAKKVKKSYRRFACQLKGAKYPEDRIKVITGIMSVKALLEASHKQDTTLTVFLCACLISSISETVSERAKRKPIVLAVPVNLRNHFPSESSRNFFSMIYLEYDYGNYSGTFEDVIKKVSEDLKEGLSRKNLAQNINTYAAIEYNPFARIVPLFLKDIFLKMAYKFSMQKVTAALSNIGMINMPEELIAYIRSFNILYGTNTLQACVCSFRDTLSISFTSPLISPEIQRHFFRKLTDLGIEVEIYANQVEDEKEEP